MEKKFSFLQISVGSKKRVLLIGLIVCVVAILSVGTLAFFIDIDKANNVITTGTIDIVLKETTIDERGNEVPFPQEGIDHVMPKMEVAKKVWVENMGTESAYVRIKIEKKITPGDLNTRYIKLGNINEIDWVQNGEYYYYISALNAGEKTVPLFDSVIFDETMPNEYQDCKVDVVVIAESVQAKNNGATVLEANGWPSEN